ncbi:MAG: hypothetical protein ABI954_15155 [Pyrinomonadaceae bacterium]
MKDSVRWTSPSPLWRSAIGETTAGARRAMLHRPGILRFATDDFMESFLQMLEREPAKLSEFVAHHETWRKPALTPQTPKPAPAALTHALRGLNGGSARKLTAKSSLGLTINNNVSLTSSEITANDFATRPLKLYQPAHGRFYLISSCLVCERPGLPDRKPELGRGEKAIFVVRRLLPPGELNINQKLPPLDTNTWEEHAFVATPQGSKWQRITGDKKTVIAGEEPQPLFAVSFTEDDGRRRKIFAGVIPTGRREAYMAASKMATGSENKTETNSDFRIQLMRSQVRDPWKILFQTVATTKAALTESDGSDLKDVAARANLVKTSREQIQTVSWLVLLDFANFLADHLPRVWQSLNGQTISLAESETVLKNAITSVTLDNAFAQNLLLPEQIYAINQIKRTLKDALLAVKPNNLATAQQIENNLDAVEISYYRNNPNQKYPSFLFPLADPLFSLKIVLGNSQTNLDESKVNEFARLIEAVLADNPIAGAPAAPAPLASQTPLDMRQGWFVIRCILERPKCAPFESPVVSDPSAPFQIAGFFDPDAPARPIRIALPLDPTPAGLRKFDKNTAFMMSDLLCGQVNRMKGITLGDLIRSVLPFPLHKDLSVPDAGGCKDAGLSVGMMCSLSIPIITICALLLLMIIVSLLDFIFRWLPFFIVCFPLPGLKAKQNE